MIQPTVHFPSSVSPITELQRIAAMMTFYRTTAFGDPFASKTDRENALAAIQRLNRQQDQIRKEIRQ